MECASARRTISPPHKLFRDTGAPFKHCAPVYRSNFASPKTEKENGCYFHTQQKRNGAIGSYARNILYPQNETDHATSAPRHARTGLAYGITLTGTGAYILIIAYIMSDMEKDNQMSFRPMFEFGPNETQGNAQRFATEAEALASAQARFMVWTMPTGYHVVESADPVNYKFDGKDVSI